MWWWLVVGFMLVTVVAKFFENRFLLLGFMP